jgi:hypothetical protein
VSAKESDFQGPRLGMRRLLAVLILVAVMGSAGYAAHAVWDRLSAFWTSVQEADDWRQRELLFLKAAYDRLGAQLTRQPGGPGADSLRGEQDVIRRMMVETAKALPPEAIPPEIRAVVDPIAVTPSQAAAASPGSAPMSSRDVPVPAGAAPLNAATLPIVATPPVAAAPPVIAAPPVAAAPPIAPAPPVATGLPIILKAGRGATPDAAAGITELSRDPGLDRKTGRPSPAPDKR